MSWQSLVLAFTLILLCYLPSALVTAGVDAIASPRPREDHEPVWTWWLLLALWGLSSGVMVGLHLFGRVFG